VWRARTHAQAVFALASGDSSKEIRKRVCQAFVLLLDRRWDLIAPYMNDIMRFMLFCTGCDDEDLALEACEMWATFAEAEVRVRASFPRNEQ
jgi:hypothetical protein